MSALLWPFVVLCGLGVLAWSFWLTARRIPVSPEPMKSLAELRGSVQKALNEAGTEIQRLKDRVVELERKHERLSTHVSGKGELIVPKEAPPARGSSGFPGPPVVR